MRGDALERPKLAKEGPQGFHPELAWSLILTRISDAVDLVKPDSGATATRGMCGRVGVLSNDSIDSSRHRLQGAIRVEPVRQIVRVIYPNDRADQRKDAGTPHGSMVAEGAYWGAVDP